MPAEKPQTEADSQQAGEQADAESDAQRYQRCDMGAHLLQFAQL